MDLSEIKRILQFMEENGLVEFEHEADGRRVKLRRAEERTIPVMAAGAAPVAAAPADDAAAGGGAEPKRPDNLVEFTSPLVGTFYQSPRPDAEPFVKVGDEVTADKVVCIIEAMKVMNEIKAEMDGVIKEIVARNGQTIEFGQPLFLIEKS